MKYPILVSLLAFALFLGGCAREAWYADREYGIASNDAFDQQIVHKDYKYSGKAVEGLDGIYAEQIMGRYLETYTESFTNEDIDTTTVGAGSN